MNLRQSSCATPLVVNVVLGGIDDKLTADVLNLRLRHDARHDEGHPRGHGDKVHAVPCELLSRPVWCVGCLKHGFKLGREAKAKAAEMLARGRKQPAVVPVQRDNVAVRQQREVGATSSLAGPVLCLSCVCSLAFRLKLFVFILCLSFFLIFLLFQVGPVI